MGGAIGLAVLATLATERADGLLADGESPAAALNSGYHLAYLIGAVLVTAAVLVALTILEPGGSAADGAHAEPELAGAEPAHNEAA